MQQTDEASRRSEKDHRLLAVWVEEKVVELWEEAYMVNGIATRLNIDRSSVKKILKKYEKI